MTYTNEKIKPDGTEAMKQDLIEQIDAREGDYGTHQDEVNTIEISRGAVIVIATEEEKSFYSGLM